MVGVKLSQSTKRFLRMEKAKLYATPVKRTGKFHLKKKKCKLYRKQNGKCEYCSNHFPLNRLTFDHVQRKKDGGSNAITNLVLACPPCNSRRELAPDSSEKVWKRWADWHRQYVLDYAL